MNTRLAPETRREMILQAAVRLANESGWLALTREAVATAAEVSPALVSAYFFTVPELRTRVMQRAIEEEHLRIIGEGLALRDATAVSAPTWLKGRALATLRGREA